MALSFKEVQSTDTLEQIIEKTNYNFDMLAQQGGGAQGVQGSQGVQGLQGAPGNAGVYWHVTSDLNTFFASPPTLTNNDLLLLTNDSTYTAINYVKGDIFRITVSAGPTYNIVLIGNIKPDNVITPTGSAGIFETVISGITEIYQRNVGENTNVPVVLSTTDTTVSNEVLDALTTYLLGGSNKSALTIYGNDGANSGGRLSFLYGEGSVGFAASEITNAPHIKATINSNELSLLISSNHNIQNRFEDEYKITGTVTDYLKINSNRDIEIFKDTGKYFNIFTSGPNNLLVVGTNDNIGVKTNLTPQQALEVNGNIRLSANGFIECGTNNNQIFLESIFGNVCLGSTNATHTFTLDKVDNTIKFLGLTSQIIGPNSLVAAPPVGKTYDFIIKSGDYTPDGGGAPDAPDLIITGGIGEPNPGATPGIGSKGGDVYLVGGDGFQLGNVYAIYDKDSDSPRGSFGIKTNTPRGDFEVATTLNLSVRNELVNETFLTSIVPVGKNNTNFNSGNLNITTQDTLGGAIFAGDINIKPGQSGLNTVGGNILLETVNSTSLINIRGTGVSGHVCLQVDGSNVPTNGNVGVGTNAPSEKLHIVDGKIKIENDYIFEVDDGTSENRINNVNNHKFIVNSDRSTVFSMELNNTDLGALSNGMKIDVINNSVGMKFIQFDNNGVDAGSITKSAGGVNYNNTSDKRLKKNIKKTKYTLDDLLKLKVVDFEWKKSGVKSTGLIAQEVKKVYPQVVSDFDEWNKKAGIKVSDHDYRYMQMDYGQLTPLLIKALQDLYSEIQQLKEKNNDK